MLTETEMKKSTMIRYKPYSAFSGDEQSLESRFLEIRILIDSDQHLLAIAKSQELIKLGLEGLRYLQT